MFNIKELIETGIKDGKDTNLLLNILAESVENEENKIEAFEKIYYIIYKDKLCDRFCSKMVDAMFNENEKGRKWTIDETNNVARKIGVVFNDDYSQAEFNAVMHMMWYDYSIPLTESGITDLSVYGKMADAYLDDADSPKGRLVNHFFFVEKSKLID